MKDKETHIAKIIRKQVSFFNGWYVSPETVDNACLIAAEKILKYLKKTQQRAGEESK